jgi:hypothetical protein
MFFGGRLRAVAPWAADVFPRQIKVSFDSSSVLAVMSFFSRPMPDGLPRVPAGKSCVYLEQTLSRISRILRGVITGSFCYFIRLA